MSGVSDTAWADERPRDADSPPQHGRSIKPVRMPASLRGWEVSSIQDAILQRFNGRRGQRRTARTRGETPPRGWSGGVQGCVCTVWWHSVSTYPSRGHRAALQEADGMRIKRERTCALGDSCTPPRRCWTCSLPKTRGEDDQGPEETSSKNGIRD